MGIKERKLKHKEDLKQSILDAAKKLFLKEGYDATSIRKIAAEIEFSPTTIYLYYKDKAAISHALHQEGFKLLASQFGILKHIEHPFERLKAMGRVYMQFALDNNDYYELMFNQKEPLDCVEDDGHWEEGEQAFSLLVMNVKACQAAGYFTQFDPESFSMVIWSTMHGLCTLKIKGHLEHVTRHKMVLQDVPDVFAHTFETFIAALEKLR
ncbi:MAG: TetR/AcrR family transcriptional regulator [Chitinophagaceae bacterium]|nr:MAG: TetR/AcrR family transcriptional regulator [Chitinophagaceae bacterium]